MKKRKKKKAKPKPNSGPVGPKCSELTASSIAMMSEEELLEGCCYPCGSGAKVEVLRQRIEKFANKDRLHHNEHMEGVMFNPLDNPFVIARTCTGGQHPTPRNHVTQLHLPD